MTIRWFRATSFAWFLKDVKAVEPAGAVRRFSIVARSGPVVKKNTKQLTQVNVKPVGTV
ncbi:MAG: hypothetical protein R6W95_12395 [Desulfosarcina sp.]